MIPTSYDPSPVLQVVLRPGRPGHRAAALRHAAPARVPTTKTTGKAWKPDEKPWESGENQGKPWEKP